MRPTIIVAILCILSIYSGCKQKKTTIDYYIFSKLEAMEKAKLDSIEKNHLAPIEPLPPKPESLRWYSPIVMIFDTANKVYMYQTECLYKESKPKCEGYFDPHYYYEINLSHPHFIGLRPEHILTLKADYLLDFLKDNDTFFRLDTNYHESNRFFYLVSDFDTIKNCGFYKLKDLIEIKKMISKRNIYFDIRRTTEEEKNVLSCKRTGKYYDASNFKWSSKFLNGRTIPLSAKYDSVENYCYLTIRTKEILKPNAAEIKPIK
jgi:hypothetical protein